MSTSSVNEQPMIPVSYGELADRYTILKIKRAKMVDREKAQQLIPQAMRLNELVSKHIPVGMSGWRLVINLEYVNGALWELEDKVRLLLAHGTDDLAPDTARKIASVAKRIFDLNDKRAAIKQEITQVFGGIIDDLKDRELPNV